MSADYADLVMASKAGDTVPFEFLAGSITLSAGTYTVTRNSPDTNSNSLLVISDHSHSSLLGETSQDEAARQHEKFDDNLFPQSIKPIYGSRLPDLLR